MQWIWLWLDVFCKWCFKVLSNLIGTVLIHNNLLQTDWNMGWILPQLCKLSTASFVDTLFLSEFTSLFRDLRLKKSSNYVIRSQTGQRQPRLLIASSAGSNESWIALYFISWVHIFRNLLQVGLKWNIIHKYHRSRPGLSKQWLEGKSLLRAWWEFS